MKSILVFFVLSATIVNTYGFDGDFASLFDQLLAKNDSPCLQAFRHLWDNDKKLFWQMIDASSKIPSGVFVSKGIDFGNYDECLDVEFKDNSTRILGKHCSPGLIIPYALFKLINIPIDDFSPAFKDEGIQLSLCMPDVCQPLDLLELISLILNTKTFSNITEIKEFTINDMFFNGSCTTKESGKDLSDLDIGVTALLSFILAIMIASTIYDVYNYKTDKTSLHPLLIAFSVFTNGRKLVAVSTTKSKEQFHCFNGLRLISMMWIVAGHGGVGWLSFSIINRQKLDDWAGEPYAGYIATGPLAVDTFFFMSGFLLAYGYLKPEKPLKVTKQIMSVPYMYLHRYLRITPALGMVFLVSISIYKYIGTGPTYILTCESMKQPCVDHWWSFFLYLQNYYNYDNICLTQTWYLAADWQMFLLSPLILIPLSLNIRKNFKAAMICLMCLNVFCVFLPLVVKYIWKDYPNPYDTHSRLCDYTIGLTLGAYMRIKMNKPFAFSRVANFLVWCFMLGLLLATIIGYQGVLMNKTYDKESIYYTFMRPMWCTGLCWIVYSCYHGYGGIVNWILTRPIMQIGGRLTYCLYCTHASVIVYYLITRRTKEYFTDFNVFYLWCGHFLVSVIVSVVWTLAFESPLITIEKFIFGGAAPKKAPAAPKPKDAKEEI